MYLKLHLLYFWGSYFDFIWMLILYSLFLPQWVDWVYISVMFIDTNCVILFVLDLIAVSLSIFKYCSSETSVKIACDNTILCKPKSLFAAPLGFSPSFSNSSEDHKPDC